MNRYAEERSRGVIRKVSLLLLALGSFALQPAGAQTSGGADRSTSPFLGSVPEGAATARPLKLSLEQAIQTGLRYETRRELTIAALAIERFRRQHGRLPAKLADLVPGFVSAVPVDWMDGNPLRYRVNADGTFTLWSIGEDLKDDGGDGSEAAPATRSTDIWERKDVVWPRRQ